MFGAETGKIPLTRRTLKGRENVQCDFTFARNYNTDRRYFSFGLLVGIVMPRYYCIRCQKLVADIAQAKIRRGSSMICRECSQKGNDRSQVEVLEKMFGMG